MGVFDFLNGGETKKPDLRFMREMPSSVPSEASKAEWHLFRKLIDPEYEESGSREFRQGNTEENRRILGQRAARRFSEGVINHIMETRETDLDTVKEAAGFLQTVNQFSYLPQHPDLLETLNPENPGLAANALAIVRIQNAIEDNLKNNPELGTGFFGNIHDFGDYIVSTPTQLFYSLWNNGYLGEETRDEIYRMALGQEGSEAALSGAVGSAIREAMDRGYLSDENDWYLEGARNELVKQGNFSVIADDPVVIDGAIDIALGAVGGAVLGKVFKLKPSFFGILVPGAGDVVDSALPAARRLGARGIQNAVIRLDPDAQARIAGHIMTDPAATDATIDIGRKSTHAGQNLLGDKVNTSAVRAAAGSMVDQEASLLNFIKSIPGVGAISREAIEKVRGQITEVLTNKMTFRFGSNLIDTNITAPVGFDVVQDKLLAWTVHGDESGQVFKLRYEDLNKINNLSTYYPQLPPPSLKVGEIVPTEQLPFHIRQVANSLGGDNVHAMAVGGDEIALVRYERMNPQDEAYKALVSPGYKPKEGKGVFSGFLSAIGSAATYLDDTARADILIAEAASARVIKKWEKQLKTLARSIKDKEARKGADKVLEGITDTEFSHLGNSIPEEGDIVRAFIQAGIPNPTDAQIKYVQKALELDYQRSKIMQDVFLQRFLNEGFTEAIEINGYTVMFKNAEMPADVAKKYQSGQLRIINAATGKIVRSKTLKDAGGRLVELTDEHQNWLGQVMDSVATPRYVFIPSVATRKMRIASAADALPFKLGVSRLYSRSRFAIKQGSRGIALSSTEAGVVKSTEAMNKAGQILSQFIPQQHSFKKMAEMVMALDGHTADMAIKALDDAGVSFIRTQRELAEFIENYQWNIFQPVDYVAQTGSINSRLMYEKVMHTFTGHYKRGVRLMDVATGQKAAVANPMQALTQTTLSAIRHGAGSRVVNRTANEWFDAAKTAGVLENPDKVQHLQGTSRLQSVALKNTTAGQLFDRNRRAILRSMHMQDYEGAHFMDNVAGRVAEIVYGKENNLIANIIRSSSEYLGKEATVDLAYNLPARLRSLAFELNLAMLNITQLTVQSAHMIPMMIMHRGFYRPDLMAKDFTSSIMLNWMMHRAGDNIDAFIAGGWTKRFALFGFDSEDDMIAFYRHAQGSGRLNIAHTTVDELSNTGYSNRLAPLRLFFNMGERQQRLMGMIYGWRDARKALPNVPPDSEEFLKKFWNIQEDVTFNMSGSMSARWQRSLLALPLQFQTYALRSLEAFGKVGWKDKVNLAIGSTLAFGGANAGNLGTSVLEELRAHDTFGMKGMTDEELQYIQYGMVGVAWNWALGGQISERVSLFGGSIDFVRQLSGFDDRFEESFLTRLTGPGVGKLYDITADTLALAYYPFNSYTDKDFMEHVSDVFSNVAAYNVVERATVAALWGQYRTRNGGIVVDDLDLNTALGIALGATPSEVVETYNKFSAAKSLDEVADDTAKMMTNLYQKARENHAKGDMDGFRANLQLAQALGAQLLPGQRDRVSKRVVFEYGTFADSVARKFIENAMTTADRIQQGE